VYFKKPNVCTIKDHYLLRYIESILEVLDGHKAYNFLVGFSWYNQVKMSVVDQPKTMIATKWGTYAYRVIPFGLSNALDTLKIMTCHIFKDFLRKFLYIFMDNLCIYSTQDDHIDKLRLALERCRLYQIALDPSKCQIMVSHGVVLGHIVSKRGITTTHDNVKVILNLEPPNQ